MPEGKPEAERAILNLLKCFEALYFFDKVGVPGRLAVSIKQHLRLFAIPPAPQISMLMASASTEPNKIKTNTTLKLGGRGGTYLNNLR